MAIRIGTYNGEPVKNYFKVWEVKEQNGFIKANCSTGRKKSKDSNEYVNSSWWMNFVGSCKDKAKELKKGDTVIPSEFQVEYTKGKDDKYWLSVTVFAFDVKKAEGEQGGFTPVDDPDGLPF